MTSLSFGQVIAQDDFSYADGSLVPNGGWTTGSGTAGDLLVSSGQAVVQHGTPSEDARQTFSSVSGDIYYALDFSVDDLGAAYVGSDNEYFSHVNFRARLSVGPGTSGGDYTVGIGSSSAGQAIWATDLTFGQSYRAVVRYDQDLGLAELWIDPVNSGSTSISGTEDGATSIDSFDLRQSDSSENETVRVDDLMIGQTFDDVLVYVVPACTVAFEAVSFTCGSNTIGDNNDGVTINIPYTNSDAGITSVTSGSGSVSGDDPASVSDGTITITGLMEGDAWDVILNGGDCDGTTVSGTVPADQCDPLPSTCIDISNGANPFDLVNVTPNNGFTNMGMWTNTSGTYAANGYCGGGCVEPVEGWLVFGPLDMTSVSDLELAFDASENFGVTDLAVSYTESYSGTPAGSTWTTVGTITDSGTFNIDISSATGTTVYVGVQYLDDGVDGYSAWSLSNVALNAFGGCPTLSSDQFETNSFNIYPNPTSLGYVNIKSNTGEAMSVAVYNILGKQVINKTVSNERLDVSSLNTGLYLMKISQGNATVTKKLVIR